MRRGTARKKLPALGENSDNTRCVDEFPDVDLTSAGPSTAQPTPALALAKSSHSMEKKVGDPYTILAMFTIVNCVRFLFCIFSEQSTGGSKN